jgi:putative DNA methylase
VLSGERLAAAITKSSADLSDLPDESIDLILTDPPYFDNLSYSELSDFYLAWHQSLGMADPPYDDKTRCSPIMENLAVTSRDVESIERYVADLSLVLRECHRVLKLDGVCVFTYHHRSTRAWKALGKSLAASGLVCTKVIPLRGEGQGGLHTYVETIKWDAVFVCRKTIRTVAEDGRVPMLSKTSMETAILEAGNFAERLTPNTQIGFRKPDALNLYRAILVGSASAGADLEYLCQSAARICVKESLCVGSPISALTVTPQHFEIALEQLGQIPASGKAAIPV